MGHAQSDRQAAFAGGPVSAGRWRSGLHLMRGIPCQAVAQNVPILGTNIHAVDIADTNSVCRWNADMYGVDMGKQGAQE